MDLDFDVAFEQDPLETISYEFDYPTEHSSSEHHDQVNETDDPEIAAIRAEAKEMEEESKRLRLLQEEVEKLADFEFASEFQQDLYAKAEADSRSVYVGNVDYGATTKDIMDHFGGCGVINRVTILRDKYSGRPKGFAYVELQDKDSVIMAEELNGSLFLGRQIKVIPKRTNTPGISSTDRRPRGRGFSSASRPPRGRGFRVTAPSSRGRGFGVTPRGRGFASTHFPPRGRGFAPTWGRGPSVNPRGSAPRRGSLRGSSRFRPY